MFQKLKNRLRPTSAPAGGDPDTRAIKNLLGTLLANNHRQFPPKTLADAEFQVHSQFGEDGILQYLIQNVGPIPDSFVEFGVENYTEANTLFLLEAFNWRGIVLDGSAENIESIRGRDLYWRHELTAVAAFITKENIDGLLTSNGFSGEIGLLSIDIDGNEYWVWQAIRSAHPVIVVVEYNSLFGCEHAVSIPYRDSFRRDEGHYSKLYYGASLKSLVALAAAKGYDFVGCNRNGSNAFFVRKDRSGAFAKPSVKEGYVAARFRQSRDAEGKLNFLPFASQAAEIADLEVWNTELDRLVSLRTVFGGGAPQ